MYLFYQHQEIPLRDQKTTSLLKRGHTNPSDESHSSTNSLELSIRDGMQLSLNLSSLMLGL